MPEEPNRQGRTVRVDGHALRVYALSAAPSLGVFATNCGLSREAVYKIVKRGTTTEATLDRISSYLGLHMSSLEVA
jgi:predicted transcriptional regulator